MRKLTLVVAMLIGFLSTAQTCGSKEEVSPSCFTDASLTNVSWQKDQLTAFQRPKSGPLAVVIYNYKGEDFLAFENGFDSGPSNHIFDCSGTTLSKRGINYNEFYRNHIKINVLLEASY